MTQSSQHPYAMYETIHAQRQEIEAIARENVETLQQIAHKVRQVQSVTLVGIGSSLHSAQLAVALWRETLPNVRVSAEHSFDVAAGVSSLRPETLRPSPRDHLVVTLSHRGTKRYTNTSLLLAKEFGTMTCAITGKGAAGPASEADWHITTVEQERSSAHTASLIGSFAALAGIANNASSRPNGTMTSALKEAIASGLSSEERIRALATSVPSDVRHIWLIGAGSDATVAREIALKIKETSYIPSEGMSVEEFAHGPFQCVDPTDLIILLDTQSFSSERIASLREMAKVVGLPSMTIITTDRAAELSPETPMVQVAPHPIGTLRSISALVALQLFTYFLALERGTNPDAFRLDDPTFKAASALIRL